MQRTDVTYCTGDVIGPNAVGMETKDEQLRLQDLAGKAAGEAGHER